MAVTPGQVAELRGRVDALQRARIEAESRASLAREEEARILAEIREAFGADTIEAAETMLADQERALAEAHASLVAAVEEAERATAGLPS